MIDAGAFRPKPFYGYRRSGETVALVSSCFWVVVAQWHRSLSSRRAIAALRTSLCSFLVVWAVTTSWTLPLRSSCGRPTASGLSSGQCLCFIFNHLAFYLRYTVLRFEEDIFHPAVNYHCLASHLFFWHQCL